jgi:hypothetical protein
MSRHEIDHSQSNVLLVLLRLEMGTHPLYRKDTPDLQPGTEYHLLAGVFDPAHRATSAPVTEIKLDGGKRETYNDVLAKFRKISDRFYKNGYIAYPESYNAKAQEQVLDDISDIGKNIHGLFPAKNPVREWIDNLLEPHASGDSEKPRQHRERPNRPVTILTNDFNIPWFWLKDAPRGPFLCEVCSLGLLQLSAAGPAEAHHPTIREDEQYDALLIKGASCLSSNDDDLDHVASTLGDFVPRVSWTFNTRRAKTRDDLSSVVCDIDKEKQLNDFRIVHFSGHYSGEKLHLPGAHYPISQLNDVLNGALLVLDGCSSDCWPLSWTIGEPFTSNRNNAIGCVMTQGAIGCVMTVLPIKFDPISSKILWGTFYRQLRLKKTVGQALAEARIELHEHFNAIGSKNPMWAAYQLLGSPAVQLCKEAGKSDSPALF